MSRHASTWTPFRRDIDIYIGVENKNCSNRTLIKKLINVLNANILNSYPKEGEIILLITFFFPRTVVHSCFYFALNSVPMHYFILIFLKERRTLEAISWSSMPWTETRKPRNVRLKNFRSPDASKVDAESIKSVFSNDKRVQHSLYSNPSMVFIPQKTQKSSQRRIFEPYRWTILRIRSINCSWIILKF